MNADQRPLDQTICEAIAAHGDAIDSPVPAFGSVLASRQQRSRRMLAVATVLVALLGVGGVVVATNRTQAPGDAVSEHLDVSPSPSVAGFPAATPTEFFCADPLGEDELGRSLFGSCEPVPGQTTGDFACTDRLGTDDTGRTRFSTCVAVGQLGPLPNDGDAPFDNPGDIAVRAISYVVQPGDYGIKIANEFCVTIEDLEAANGWIDNSREFPFPGTVILIPNGFDESTCDSGSYTVTPDDTTRIAVADKFCISVQALDTANADTDGYSGFFPGLVIVIPPSSDQTC